MVCVTLLSDADMSGFPFKYLIACSPQFSTVHGQSNIESANIYTKFINLIQTIGEPDSIVLPGKILSRFNVKLYKPIMGSRIYNALVDSITFKTTNGNVTVNRITNIDAYIDVVNKIESINTVLTNADIIINVANAMTQFLKGINNPETRKDLKLIKPLTSSDWVRVIEKYKDIIKYSSERVNAVISERQMSELKKLNISHKFIESVPSIGEVSFTVADFDEINASVVIKNDMILINSSDAEIFKLLLGENIGAENIMDTNVFSSSMIMDVITLSASLITKSIDKDINTIIAVKPENIRVINHLIAAIIRLLPCLFMSPDKAIERLSNVSCNEGQLALIGSILNKVKQLIRAGNCDEAYEYINKELIALGI